MEQYMMYHKAKLFNDQVIMQKVLDARDPRQHKRLGRLVSRFDEQVWKENRLKIVYQGNKEKFTQNTDLMKALKRTRGTTLVESSPYDKIWGIGMKGDDPKAKDRGKWKGLNLLGKVLTYLRCELLEERYDHLDLRASDLQ